MTSGYLLIGAMLILGGIIAVSGDRIGTRVGKARLTLFKLRPRQTATLVTIVTGTLISASVLTLIFGSSEQLRTGVFDLQKIQRKLSDTKENLARALEQKDRVQRDLAIARNEQSEAKDVLMGINKSFKDELLKQSIAAQNFKNTQDQLQAVSLERNDLVRSVAEIDRQRSDAQAQQQTIADRVQQLNQRMMGMERTILKLQTQLTIETSQRDRLNAAKLAAPNTEPESIDRAQRRQTAESTVKKTSRDLEQATTRLTNLELELQTQQAQLLAVEALLEQLDPKLAVLQAQLKAKSKQNQTLEREFQTRATQLKLQDRQLKKVESQVKTNRQGLASLEKEVNNIEQEYRKIRQGNIGILRNQVLASTIVKVSSTATATKAINALLIQANLAALQAINPDNFNSKRQIIDISSHQLAQLKQQVASSAIQSSDQQDYVVRVFSTGNYLVGDRDVQVFIDATPNQKLFSQAAQIANVQIEPVDLSEEQIRQQLNILLVTSQLRARRAGILDDRPQIGDGQLATYVQFIERVKQQKNSIEIRTIVDRDTYTLGPLIVQLQATANGKVLFSTYSNAAISSSSVH